MNTPNTPNAPNALYARAMQELPSTVVLGFGKDGSALLPHILNAQVHARGGSPLAAFGLCHWDRPTSEPAIPLPRLPAPDITLTADEIQHIRESGRQIAGQTHLLPAQLLQTFWDKLLEVVPPSAPIIPQLLVLAGLRDSEIIAPSLSQVKSKRLPDLSITLCVRWPEPGHYDAHSTAAIKILHALRQEQIVDVVYPIDPRSPLVRSLGEDMQTQMLARVFAAQLIAHRHDGQNKRLSEVTQSVGTLVEGRGTFADLALGVAPVASGTRHALARMFRWGLSAEVGVGDFADCFRQATDLAARLLDDERARTFAAPFDREAPPYELLFIVPFAMNDPRFGRMVRELRAWQSAEVPQAGTPVVVSGSGRLTADGHIRYYCLAAYIFGIADELLLPQTPTADRKGSSS